MTGVVVAATLAAAASTFLGWGTSGSRTRSPYELVSVVEQAAIIDGRYAALARGIYAVPVAAGVMLLAISAGQPRLAGVAATTVAVTVLTASVLVARSPLQVEWGVTMGIVTAAIAAVSGVLLALDRRR